MLKLGLSAEEQRDWVDVLDGDALLETTLTVLDMAGNVVGPLDTDVHAGQVLVDRHATVTRMLYLDLADPTGSLEFHPDSAADNAIYLNHQLQVAATVYVPSLDDHVTCPYFTGPVHRLWRDGATVHVQAHGKERRMLRPCNKPLRIARDTPKIDAIRQLLARGGETMFALPESTEMLAEPLALARGERPWTYAKRVAASMDLQLYYRGDGYVTVRPLPTEPLVTFRQGDEDDPSGNIVGDPRIWFELGDRFANTVEVLGPPPRGPKQRIRVPVYLPESHPLSRESMASDPTDVDTGTIVVQHINDQVRSEAQAEALGTRILNDLLIGVTQTRFDAVPYYHLEEGDYADLDTGATSVPFRLDKFSLPVGTKGRHVMTVGHHTKTTPTRWEP